MSTYTKEALDRQLALEAEMRNNGIARYRERLAKAQKNADETSITPVTKMLQAALAELAAGVEAFYAKAKSGRPGTRVAVAYPLLKGLDAPSVAFLTAKAALDCVSRIRELTAAAVNVGRVLEDEVWFRAFSAQKPFLWNAITDALLAEDVGSKQRQARLRRSVTRYEIDVPVWTEKERLLVGLKCLDLLIEHTGWFEIVTFNKRGRDVHKVFQPTAATSQWVNEANAGSELLSPMYLPMIVHPVDWTTPLDGGYITHGPTPLRLVQTRNDSYLEELANNDMPMVYDAINAVQRTAWQINAAVLSIMQDVWKTETGLGGLPTPREEELPTFPADKTDKGAIKEWKRVACLTHQGNGKRRSRRIACGKALWVAHRLEKEPAIYFPHYCDFRGRIYPRPLYLTPQGADYAKGLLRFSEGKPLGETGASWLAVHGANLYGQDKVALDERIKWTQESQANILASAASPLDHKWWADADQPWQFLAFCFEWAGYVREGVSFVSHLPIALDGSCNGLQNFSMALRDEVGGAAVNLVPSDKPQDIYQQVADRVMSKLVKDEANLTMATLWITSGLVTRALCKKPVMTLPYGAKQYGMRNGVAEFIEEANETNPEPTFKGREVFGAAVYIAKIIWDSISEVVVAARAAMDFLQEAARLAASDGLPIHWYAPSGFYVVQEYKTLVGKVVETQLGGERLYLTLSRDGDRLDKKRQALGVSPNFVHSLDAAHLMRTVTIATLNGVTAFAMIHDSYGTHAANTAILGASLREAFVDQYKTDVMAKFRTIIASQLLPENLAALPQVPPMGNLDADAVRDAAFFFA